MAGMDLFLRLTRRLGAALLALSALAGAHSIRAQDLQASEMPPPEPREFRAAWVATVANIDWPSAPGLSTEQQRHEALAILDKARTMGLNALVLQVRPSGDALYPSTLEPWSEYLTGAPGRAPEPIWDPLAFWVQQAHLRGMELHAWFNPYRARPAPPKTGPLVNRQPLVAPHLAVRRPDLAKTYGDLLWFDPGESDAAAQTLAVVADVVRRYDIDAVHIDDYFYPYPLAVDGVDQPFPDDDSYARYRLAGGELARNDWRRANVNSLVQQLQRTVQGIKPWVRLGISPFGLGKPDRRPSGISGFSQYDKLYADVELWLANGWLDYLAPQLYWQIDRPGLQFPVLMDYWVSQNTAGRHMWPGLFTSMITKGEPGTVLGNRAWLAREVLDQVELMRQRAPRRDATDANPGVTGHLHFSMATLMQDRDGIATLLQFGRYNQPALVPATPWLGATPPPTPSLTMMAGARGPRLLLAPGTARDRAADGTQGASAIQAYALWLRVGGQWRLQVLGPGAANIDAAGADAAVASAVSRTGMLSARTSLRLVTLTPIQP